MAGGGLMTEIRESDTAPPVDRCPWCEEKGEDVRGVYDGRILVGGRGVYRCPNDPEHRWQNTDEKPDTSKAVRLRRPR
jgi:hypothetical protein